jgi:hypothetical protein
VESSCYAEQVNQDGLHCTVSMVRFSTYLDYQQGYESFRFLTVEGRTTGQRKFLLRADLLPVEFVNYPLCFIGRMVDHKRISPQMVQRWLKQCEALHARQVWVLPGLSHMDLGHAPPLSKHRFDTLVPSLYFIDVRQNCLSRLPTFRSICHIKLRMGLLSIHVCISRQHRASREIWQSLDVSTSARSCNYRCHALHSADR